MGDPSLATSVHFPPAASPYCPNNVFSCYLIFPALLRTFEWTHLDQELLKNFKKNSECVGMFFDPFGQAGQCEAALWPVSLVWGDASSLAGAQHAVMLPLGFVLGRLSRAAKYETGVLSKEIPAY